MSKTSSFSTLCLWLTLAAGVTILYPSLDMQGLLSTGDHGRDFYAFERTLQGDVPYQDYWWVYGPLMPYYYAVFNFFLGVNMMSILIGKAFLVLTSGLLLFLTLETLGGSLAALTGACWFFVFNRDFFYTHSHSGGITFIMLLLFSVARYITTRKDSWLWIGMTAIFVLSLIKLNFGIVSIPFLMIAAYLTDKAWGIAPDSRKIFFHSFLLFFLPLLIFAVYWLMLYGLSPEEIFQCLPYASADQQYLVHPWISLMLLFKNVCKNALSHPTDAIFGSLVILSFFRSLNLLTGKTLSLSERKTLILTLLIFAGASIVNLHEFLKSSVYYRINWAQPAGIIWMFALIAMATRGLTLFTRGLVFGIILILTFNHHHTVQQQLNAFKTSKNYLSHPKGKVFVTNDPAWIRTVEDTANFLQKTVPTEALFFALPYDPIYYYLTNRPSPTRQLIFFDHINVNEAQERAIIHELATKNVNFVLLSNRINSREAGLGVFGITYCRLLARYINENFEPVAQFGDWQHEPGWSFAHGTVVLKRKGTQDLKFPNQKLPVVLLPKEQNATSFPAG